MRVVACVDISERCVRIKNVPARTHMSAPLQFLTGRFVSNAHHEATSCLNDGPTSYRRYFVVSDAVPFSVVRLCGACPTFAMTLEIRYI